MHMHMRIHMYMPIEQVVVPTKGAAAAGGDVAELEEAFVEPGFVINSGEGLDGLSTSKAKKEMIRRLSDAGRGEGKVSSVSHSQPV